MSSCIAPSKGTIFIYNDVGTCQASCHALLDSLGSFPHTAILFATSHYLREAFWESETSLLVLPGGICKIWEENLGSAGMKKIQDYLQIYKGRVLGICAGGYYISKFSLFDIGSVRIQKERPFPLFPGRAEGPLKTSCSSPEIAEAVTLYTPSDTRGEVYYQQGCAFTGPTNTVIHASYEDPHSGTAIVSYTEDDWVVVGCGPHIEFSPPRTRSPFEKPEISDLFDKLTAGITFRSLLWADIRSALFPDYDDATDTSETFYLTDIS